MTEVDAQADVEKEVRQAEITNFVNISVVRKADSSAKLSKLSKTKKLADVVYRPKVRYI